MKRFEQTLEVKMKDTTLEEDGGGVISMHRTMLMSSQETVYDLHVKGDQAEITIKTVGPEKTSTIDWSPEILGPMAVWRLRKDKGLEPGTVCSYKSFSFDVPKIATTKITVKALEETDLLDGDKAQLYHCIGTVDLMPGQKTHEWCPDDCISVKTSVVAMGIQIETYQTSKERALKAGGGELKADLLIESMAQSNVTLPSPYTLDTILYRFALKNQDYSIPETLADSRQEVIESDGKTARVRITVRLPDTKQAFPLKNPPKELAEYLTPNAYIQSDDPALSAKAVELTKDAKDAWEAACILERFVYDYIKDKNFGTGFASAAEVFANPRGDCSEHGVLLAALCRAIGIPSRVALGYMYLGGIFGGHMWAEVWIDGEWFAIDGVMGIGRVDPTHIRFSSSSLAQGGLGEAYINALSGLGNLDLTILEFTRGDRTIHVDEEFKDYEIEGDTYRNVLYNISFEKPSGFDFVDFERDLTGIDFELVAFEGTTHGHLMALPAVFSFSQDDLRKVVTQGRGKIMSELPRRAGGREGTVFQIKRGDHIGRAFGLITKDTCFILSLEIEEEERDILFFEKMVSSIRFD